MGSISSARHRFSIERKTFEVVLEGLEDDLVRFTEYSKGGRRRSVCLSPAEAVWFVDAWESLFASTSSSDFRKLRTAKRSVLLSIRSNFNGRFVKLTKVNGGEPRSIIFPEGDDAAGWENVFNKSRAIVDLLPGKFRRASKLRKSAPPPTAKDFPPLQAAELNFKRAVAASPMKFSISCPGCSRQFDGSLFEASSIHPDPVKEGGSSKVAPPRAPLHAKEAPKKKAEVAEEKRASDAPARVRRHHHRGRRPGFGPVGKSLGRLVYRPKPVQPGLTSSSIGPFFDPLAEELARGSREPSGFGSGPGFYEPVGPFQVIRTEPGPRVSGVPGAPDDDAAPSLPRISTPAFTEEDLALIPCEDFAMECTPICVGSPEAESEAASASDRVLDKVKSFSSIFGIPLEGAEGDRTMALFTKIEKQRLEEALPKKSGEAGSKANRELKRLEFAVNYDKVSHPR